MCGIAGWVFQELADPAARAAVGNAADAMARRGPDAEGIHAWPHAVFGHRRLAILDLSDAGRQPMVSEDGAVGLVFNGCIYNFAELRAELARAGYRFHSQTDTEAILLGYLEWGIDELAARLRGMFAFAIWDEAKQVLFLVRDRLGVKPLLYLPDRTGLRFGSTAQALSAMGADTTIDPAAILDFLEFGYVTDSHAIYSGMRKVQAGSIVEWHRGEISQRTYWTLPHAEESSPITFDEAVEETQKLLLDAVRLRLYADVPIGALLSGGIDSTLICWAMTRLNANVRSFTVSTEGDAFDEAADASATARILGIPHEIVSFPRQTEADIPEDLIQAWGEPFGCSSALGMLQVSNAVKPMATVLLTGDGGDDVFLGYPFHRHFYQAQRLAGYMPDVALPMWRAIRPAVRALPGLRRPMHFLDYATGGLGSVTRVHDGLPYFLNRGMLGERLAHLSLQQRTIPLSMTSARRLLSDVLDYDQQTRFTGEFMTKVDGGAMHYAIEARSPFLDQRIWEFAARLPFAIRLRGDVLKAILREIVRKHVGPEVAFRRKQGFSIPVERWMTAHWLPLLHDLAERSLLEQEGWIRPDSIREAVRTLQPGSPAPTQLWYLLVLERWLKNRANTPDRWLTPAAAASGPA